jgi:hypothetical protein
MTAVGVMAARGYHDEVLGRICTGLVLGVVALAAISAANYTLRGIEWLRRR